MNPEIEQIAIALALGLLVGMERESGSERVAGIRTFALITMLGAVAGIFAVPDHYGLLAAGWICLSILLVAAKVQRWRTKGGEFGLTTEIAALLMFGVGFLLSLGHLLPALMVSGTLLVLLRGKQRMHAFVKRMGEADLSAVAQLALIGLVILPALPDEPYGPYGVLNPREIWAMVVLISGISMAAYLIHRVLGARVGSILGGLLGGLISSTAATVSYARQARKNLEAVPLAALGILLATTVVQVRVAIEVAVVSPELLGMLAWPFALMTLVLIGECAVLWWLGVRKAPVDAPAPEHPAQLGAAILFGLLYAGVLLTVAAVRDAYGGTALYGVAAVSGLTDVDAITLSTARLYDAGHIVPQRAWRVIVLAVMSNLAFKGVAAWVLGGRGMRNWVVLPFVVAIAAGGLLLWLWPA